MVEIYVKLNYVVVLCGAERVKTISHESLQCLCSERRSSKSLARRGLCSTIDFFGCGALPASDRGGSAHRLRSGLRPRAADRRPVLGIGSVPPPAAPAGCQSPVSGTRLETRRLVREALTLHARPHALLLARNKHRTECLVIQRCFACRESRPAQTTNPALASMHARSAPICTFGRFLTAPGHRSSSRMLALFDAPLRKQPKPSPAECTSGHPARVNVRKLLRT